MAPEPKQSVRLEKWKTFSCLSNDNNNNSAATSDLQLHDSDAYKVLGNLISLPWPADAMLLMFSMQWASECASERVCVLIELIEKLK